MFKLNGIAVSLLCLPLALAPSLNVLAENLRPQIDGDWWSVAGNPDLGKYTSDKQEAADC